MRPLRLAAWTSYVGGGVLAVLAILYAGYTRLEVLPRTLPTGDVSGLQAMQLAWALALAGMMAALIGVVLLPRTAAD